MPKKKTDKKKDVTIFVVHTADDDEDDDLFLDDDEDDDDDDSPECSRRTYNTRNKKAAPIIPKVPKVPISSRFLINKSNPITNLKSLIEAFNHPDADKKQIEFVNTLRELDNMIGMEKFKEQLINQILFFVQDMQEPGLFLHTVLTGPPGTGKTTAINILAKIYSKMGILESEKVVIADRSTLIGKWLGSTAIKTKEVLESAKGGVLLLDEVYSLGNKESGDSYSKECIDTINQYLSEHVDEFICVIAGYKDLVQECFFNYNPGLERRFPWRFTIDPYTHDELSKIMKIQIINSGWKVDVDDKYLNDIIRLNKEHFNGNGGDTKNFIDKCKIAHARRVFTLQEISGFSSEPGIKKRRNGKKTESLASSPNIGPSIISTKIINKEDIDTGLTHFITSKKKTTDELSAGYMGMYI